MADRWWFIFAIKMAVLIIKPREQLKIIYKGIVAATSKIGTIIVAKSAVFVVYCIYKTFLVISSYELREIRTTTRGLRRFTAVLPFLLLSNIFLSLYSIFFKFCYLFTLCIIIVLFIVMLFLFGYTYIFRPWVLLSFYSYFRNTSGNIDFLLTCHFCILAPKRLYWR